MDDDVVGTTREERTGAVMTCDLCGAPVGRDALVDSPLEQGARGPGAMMHLCPSCHRRVEADDVPVSHDPFNSGIDEGP